MTTLRGFQPDTGFLQPVLASLEAFAPCLRVLGNHAASSRSRTLQIRLVIPAAIAGVIRKDL